MTQRDITGDARSKFSAARKLASEAGLDADALAAIAEGVREFDANRTSESRSALALERIANALNGQHKGGPDHHVYEERRLRRREVYAQELFAVALIEDDPDGDVMTSIQGSDAYKRLVARLAGPAADGNVPAPDATA